MALLARGHACWPRAAHQNKEDGAALFPQSEEVAKRARNMLCLRRLHACVPKGQARQARPSKLKVPGSQVRHCDPVAASTEVPDGHGPMFRRSMRSGRAVCGITDVEAAVPPVVAGA